MDPNSYVGPFNVKYQGMGAPPRRRRIHDDAPLTMNWD